VAILIDPALWQWRGRRWAHLVSDLSYDELHAFAFRLGLQRRWFQGDHYDVPSDYRHVAIALGAQPVDSRQLVGRLRASSLRLTGAQRRQVSRQVIPGLAAQLGAIMSPMPSSENRPVDDAPVHTAALPATPQRDRTIPATAWLEAPAALVELGTAIGEPLVAYKRRIGGWLLWRAGPASHGNALYMALADDDLSLRFTFRLYPDGHGSGLGPDGVIHERFRLWKEALRDTSARATTRTHE
jgi:Protein of unknown function (DUF4031)